MPRLDPDKKKPAPKKGAEKAKKKPNRAAEDSPGFNPFTQGNKRSGLGSKHKSQVWKNYKKDR